MEIGKKLRQARTQAGLTQEQAAERILVSRQTVSNWETGETLPNIETLKRLSDLFDVSSTPCWGHPVNGFASVAGCP